MNARRNGRPPTMVSSFLLLAATDLSLRTLGFSRTVAIARRLAHARASADSELVSEICRRVAVAAVLYPGRARCLEQSMALYVLLRRRGIAADLRLGVQPYPFNAHAWVELNGVALNEEPEIISQFVPLEGFAI